MGQLAILHRISAAGIAGVLIGLFVVLGTSPLPESSRAFPQLAGYLMIGLGALDILRLAVAGPNEAETSDRQQSKDTTDVRTIVKFLVVTALYVGLLPVLGFYVTTLVYLVGGIWYLGARKWWQFILVPIIVISILYYGFSVQLRIPLPAGLLL